MRGHASLCAALFLAAAFLVEVFLAAVFLLAVFLVAAFLAAGSFATAFLAAAFFAGAFLAAFLVAPRPFFTGAAASSSMHCASVRSFGSWSLGMRAFFSPSVMYGP